MDDLMVPSSRLRWALRKIEIRHWNDPFVEWGSERVLQQWWQGGPAGEWRDVPVEEEGKGVRTVKKRKTSKPRPKQRPRPYY